MLFLKKHYIEIVQPDLLLTDARSSAFTLPRLVKINLLVKGFTDSELDILSASIVLELISHQRPYFQRQKSNKVVVGSSSSLRKTLMYQFLSRLLFEVLPKVKQFEGLKHPAHPGVYSFRLNDLLIFGEVPQFLNQEHGVVKDLHCELHFNTQNSLDIMRLGRLLTICFQEAP